MAKLAGGKLVSAARDLLECCTLPAGQCCSEVCGLELCDRLPEHGPLGTREDALHALARVARLVYGAGFVDEDDWGKFDPPLNGEGWTVADHVCETRHSEDRIQAACYVRSRGAGAGEVAAVAFRGTVSYRGLKQDLSLACSGSWIRTAVREACEFFERCAEQHPDKHLYVTGHSLGGYIAEAVASHHGVDGVVFNSPGPWSMLPLKNVCGELRPSFEVHLTRSDPLAAVAFPKPENSAHIARPIWHAGRSHRKCKPYMVEVADMKKVRPNNLGVKPLKGGRLIDRLRDVVDQSEVLGLWSDSGSDSGDSSDSE